MAESTNDPHAGAEAKRGPDLIPPEFLRVIAVWSIVPAYLVAGGFVGYLFDRWFGTFPYLMAVGLLVALAMSVRDMLRLRNEFEREATEDER
ncbi:MAG: AtpZ/AtpI family protein [Coriobacteriales bacterium]|nr:AtpZ/AtpI family protein [Coriobacteriales bacterium]